MRRKDNLRQKFEENFALWSKAIIVYCKDTQVKSTALQIETADYSEDLDVGKLTFIAMGIRPIRIELTRVLTQTVLFLRNTETTYHLVHGTW